MASTARDKPLNQMNRLADMGHFPVAVHAGATLNVLLTLAVTWLLQPRFPEPWAPVLWTALVVTLNLTPVVLLRLTLTPATVYPTLARMNFFHDQHKFSDWVYLAASANMSFWILTAWALFTWRHTPATLLLTLATAALATFSPVLRRSLRITTAK